MPGPSGTYRVSTRFGDDQISSGGSTVSAWPGPSESELSVSGWLRSQTRREHSAAEAELDFGLVQDRAGLVALLRGWDEVWRAVWWAASLSEAGGPAAGELQVMAGESRRWIEADMAGLGVNLDDGLGDWPAGDSGTRLAGRLALPADRWGVAYVLRGSRLGGAVLASRVRAALALPDDCGTRYLASTGANPGREWIAFRRRLDACALAPSELAGAVDAARWTFGWVGATIAARLGASVSMSV